MQTLAHYFETGQICNVTSKSDDNRYYCAVNILGKSYAGLLDSGATSSVVSKSFYAVLQSLGFIAEEIPEINLTTADGTPHGINKALYLPMEFANKYNVVKFYVMNNIKHELLLGINFFDAFQLSINVNSDMQSKLKLGKREEINSMAIVENPVISREELKDNQKQELDQIITEITNLIGVGLGRTSLIQHRIDTADHLPVAQRQYPFAPPIMRELEQEVEEMLNNDVIEPSYSSWRSPVLLVKKTQWQEQVMSGQ